MEHILYLDGNLSNISWVIQTNETIVSQSRKHTENYKNRITKIAIKETPVKDLEKYFTGPTAAAISSDPINTAKILTKFAKSHDKTEGEISTDIFLRFLCKFSLI